MYTHKMGDMVEETTFSLWDYFRFCYKGRGGTYLELLMILIASHVMEVIIETCHKLCFVREG